MNYLANMLGKEEQDLLMQLKQQLEPDMEHGLVSNGEKGTLRLYIVTLLI